MLLAGDLAGVLAGAAAMLGHWRPLFLGFSRGGKMVATAGGVVWAVAPLVALAGAAIWIAVFVVFRYSSLASLVAAALLPAIAAVLGEPWPVLVFAVAAAAAVFVLHRANLRRLRDGTESRFERRRRDAAAGA